MLFNTITISIKQLNEIKKKVKFLFCLHEMHGQFKKALHTKFMLVCP